jgi:amidase
MAPGTTTSIQPESAGHLARTLATIQPSDIVMMDGVALMGEIRSRRVSCVEVMKAYLDHIDRINPCLNAIVARCDRSSLLTAAQERDVQAARGQIMGPLHGLPQAVKDLLPVKGIPMTMGSPILKDFIPSTDSIMVERLRKAGAIFIGKTNTPEFGFGSQTYNSVYGSTRNAYDQSRTAGGSSGGAAVALAARMLPVADGNDYAGSLRNPAGWNNVFGFRTSYGRVPSDARDVWLPSMNTIGPMARNVADLAMLLGVQNGYDDRAPLSIAGDMGTFAEHLKKDMRGARIAWARDFKGYLPYEPGVLDVCEAALKIFEQLGCIVEEAQPNYPIDKVWRAWLRLRAWHSSGPILAYYDDPAKRALMKPEAIFEVESGKGLSAFDVTAASLVRSEWYHAVRHLFEQYDYVIVPTAQLFPFDVEIPWPREIAGRPMETYHEWMKCALIVAMSGCPALAVPAGFSRDGLPIGIQIVGRHHADVACLQLAFAYDAATNWATRCPPPLLSEMLRLPKKFPESEMKYR